jgi:hypothetical protein
VISFCVTRIGVCNAGITITFILPHGLIQDERDVEVGKGGFDSIENEWPLRQYIGMEHTYLPREFGKLIGKSVNALQK